MFQPKGGIYELSLDATDDNINELSKFRKELKTITVEEQPEWKKVLIRLKE